MGRAHPLYAAFERWLALPASRIGVNDVLDLMSLPEVARRFGLDAGGPVSYTHLDVYKRQGVLPLLDRQPEFTTALWDYLAALVDSRRIAQGKERMATYAPLLAQVQVRTGVDPATVVAVWGVESDYGQNFGQRPLLQSLGTLCLLYTSRCV